jgi:hypothetical protein
MRVLHLSGVARRSRRASGREAGGRRSTAAGQDSERMRAHLYEREFAAKPVTNYDHDVNAGCVMAEPCGALDSCQGHARFVRTNVTWVFGRERPLRLDHGAKKGAAKWGSLTPHCRQQPRRYRHGRRHGRHRAPPGEHRAKYNADSEFRIVRRAPCSTPACGSHRANGIRPGRTVLPRLRSPLPNRRCER